MTDDGVHVTDAECAQAIWDCVVPAPVTIAPRDTTRPVACMFLVGRFLYYTQDQRAPYLYVKYDLHTRTECSDAHRLNQDMATTMNGRLRDQPDWTWKFMASSDRFVVMALLLDDNSYHLNRCKLYVYTYGADDDLHYGGSYKCRCEPDVLRICANRLWIVAVDSHRDPISHLYSLDLEADPKEWPGSFDKPDTDQDAPHPSLINLLHYPELPEIWDLYEIALSTCGRFGWNSTGLCSVARLQKDIDVPEMWYMGDYIAYPKKKDQNGLNFDTRFCDVQREGNYVRLPVQCMLGTTGVAIVAQASKVAENTYGPPRVLKFIRNDAFEREFIKLAKADEPASGDDVRGNNRYFVVYHRLRGFIVLDWTRPVISGGNQLNGNWSCVQTDKNN